MHSEYPENAEYSLKGKKKAFDEAAAFIDSIPKERVTRFDDMTKAEIKMERLKDCGLISPEMQKRLTGKSPIESACVQDMHIYNSLMRGYADVMDGNVVNAATAEQQILANQ